MTRNLSARKPEERARWSAAWRRSIAGAAVALMTATAVGGCASGHSQRGNNQSIVVHLKNDLALASDVTVYAVTQDGIKRLLGDVPPNKDRVLTIPNDIFPGSTFRLVAEKTGGSPVVSQPITATSAITMIDWDLQQNSLWFPEAG